MARTMLFISISPKRSARITIPWTALIYVPSPRPLLNLAGSCRDALIGRELETGSTGGRYVYLLTSFFFFPFKVSPWNQTRRQQICSALRPYGRAGPGPRGGPHATLFFFRNVMKLTKNWGLTHKILSTDTTSTNKLVGAVKLLWVKFD